MAKKKQTLLSRETTHLINEDGVVLTSQIITTKRVRPDQFLQVYLEDFASLMRINGDAEFKVILWIGKAMNYQTNEIVLVEAIKQKISKDCEIALNTINNTIASLLRKDILIRTQRSVYTLNPDFFFKGRLEERDQLRRTIIYQLDKEQQEENPL